MFLTKRGDLREGAVKLNNSWVIKATTTFPIRRVPSLSGRGPHEQRRLACGVVDVSDFSGGSPLISPKQEFSQSGSRSILGEGCELKDYKTPRDVTVGKKETVAFDSSNVEKNESLKGTRNGYGLARYLW